MKEDAAIKTKSSGNYQQSLKEKAHDIKHKVLQLVFIMHFHDVELHIYI